MHSGLSMLFQGLSGLNDTEMYRAELGLAARAESDGFDSIWTPEHHFSDHGVTPNVAQFLSWVAGRTERMKLGTMVTVLPWHDPVRVAESFTLLDHLSDGRAILGIGRGLGRVEFESFRVEMGESRRRFTEYTTAVVDALESGFIEYDGELYKQPRTEIRPRPLKSFKGRTFASAISPQSIDLMARLGVGLMIIPQKPWVTVDKELAEYAVRFREINGEEAPKPVLAVHVCVGKTEQEAQQMHDDYLIALSRATVNHYEFQNIGLASIEGYEYYGALAKNIEKHGVDRFYEFLADLQVWGTPEQVTKTMLDYIERTDAGAILSILSFGGMSPETALANQELFVQEVLPVLKAHDAGGDIGVRHSPTAFDRTPPVAELDDADDVIMPVL